MQSYRSDTYELGHGDGWETFIGRMAWKVITADNFVMSETDCFCLDINELIRVMGLNGTSDVLRQIISQNHNAIV